MAKGDAMKKSLCLLGLLLLLCASVAFGKATTSTQLFRDPDVQVTWISCSGVVVEGTADVLVRVHTTYNAAGGTNSRIIISFSGTGSDVNGNLYNFNVQERPVALTTNGKGQIEVSSSINANLVGRGGTFNESMHGVLHFTITNGVMTADVANAHGDCP